MSLLQTTQLIRCHPPREDVSWNDMILKNALKRIVILLVRMWVEMQILCHDAGDAARHPPREDVSWNTSSIPLAYTDIVILLVRMWVEIASALPAVWLAVVILLVRMWVEMLLYTLGISQQSSHPPREDVSWNIAIYRWNITTKVILLVMMWVEMCYDRKKWRGGDVILLVRRWVEIQMNIFVLW